MVYNQNPKYVDFKQFQIKTIAVETLMNAKPSYVSSFKYNFFQQNVIALKAGHQTEAGQFLARVLGITYKFTDIFVCLDDAYEQGYYTIYVTIKVDQKNKKLTPHEKQIIQRGNDKNAIWCTPYLSQLYAYLEEIYYKL